MMDANTRVVASVISTMWAPFKRISVGDLGAEIIVMEMAPV